jgi:2,5-diamino-6-(ribosylamino)-4(3H)-pyrimidinone 5'-phosphate reductase
MSLDGKISTGDTDELDVDQDYKYISGLREGLKQYYDLERQTDLFSINTGKVFAKIGVNEKTDEPNKLSVSFIVVDNEPHLTSNGVIYLMKKSKKLILVTTNPSHPAFAIKQQYSDLEVILYKGVIDFKNLFLKLYKEYEVEKLTVQSGGTLNTILVREGLINRVLLVVAPTLIGGKNTPTIMDGESLHTREDLFKIKTLEFVQAKPLNNSYLLLEYKVKN